MHLATKREEKPNKPQSTWCVPIFHLFYFHISSSNSGWNGFGNCEDLVTGTSETGDISKTNHISGMFSLMFGFGVFFNMGRTGL